MLTPARAATSRIVGGRAAGEAAPLTLREAASRTAADGADPLAVRGAAASGSAPGAASPIKENVLTEAEDPSDAPEQRQVNH
jgi:hypothetical protein